MTNSPAKAKSSKKRKKKSAVQRPVKTRPDELLLAAVVRVVAKRGVEGASTRAIAAEAGGGITDTVIYRYFAGKDELLHQAFLRESNAFMAEVGRLFSVLWETNLSREHRLRFLWHTIWTWLTHHPAESAFMIRYYYSASFTPAAMADYHKIWQPLADRLSELLPGKDTEALVFMALETTAAANYPVCTGWREDGAAASEYGFRRLMGLVNEFLND